MWKALSPRSKPSLMNERSTLCCSSKSLKKAQICRCGPSVAPAQITEPPFVAMFHLLPLRADVRAERTQASGSSSLRGLFSGPMPPAESSRSRTPLPAYAVTSTAGIDLARLSDGRLDCALCPDRPRRKAPVREQRPRGKDNSSPAGNRSQDWHVSAQRGRASRL